MKRIDVAVAVIRRENQVFICKRADNLHQGGKWEFPGGKKEANESIEQALARELMEEVGIVVRQQQPFMLIEHDYVDKQVRLDVRMVAQFDGEPHGKEGQPSRWVAIEQLPQYTFPQANQAIINKLLALAVEL